MQLNDRAGDGRARRVTAERLDHLAPDDPLAICSRRDLQRIHRVMRSLSILQDALSRLSLANPPLRILELGAGDGTLLLRLARTRASRWSGVELTLLDRHDLLSSVGREAYRQLGWNVTVDCADVLQWARSPLVRRYDLCITTLFLHHFDSADLGMVLAGVAARTDAFIACEPRRSPFARMGSRLLGLLGANEVTREDGAKSVAAGFSGSELTQLWSQANRDWWTREYPAWPFTHCFVAARPHVRALVPAPADPDEP